MIADDAAILHFVHVDSQSILFSQQLASVGETIQQVALALRPEIWVIGIEQRLFTFSNIDITALNAAVADGNVEKAMLVSFFFFFSNK